jgi:hypothetical protein
MDDPHRFPNLGTKIGARKCAFTTTRHSFNWWPVWVTGYIMAVVTRLDGQLVQIGNAEVYGCTAARTLVFCSH